MPQSQTAGLKDFVDLFAILREHKTLEASILLYRKKYEVGDVTHLLNSLVYFDDAERDPMPSMLWKNNWVEIKKEVVRHVRAFVGSRTA